MFLQLKVLSFKMEDEVGMKSIVRITEEANALAKELLAKLLLLLEKGDIPVTAKHNLRSLEEVLKEINKTLELLKLKHFD